MLFSVEQAFVGRDEKQAPLKTRGWEAKCYQSSVSFSHPFHFPSTILLGHSWSKGF